MRKALPIVVVLLSVVLSATGCDFFRTLAGRPTSIDIAAKREAIRLFREDSLKKAAQLALADSLAAVDSLPSEGETHKTVVSKSGKKRFYVIMGAFSSRDNAERCASRLKEKGYETEFFGFTEGRTAVGIGGTDDEAEVKKFLSEIKGQDFCPQGVWILDRKRK